MAGAVSTRKRPALSVYHAANPNSQISSNTIIRPENAVVTGTDGQTQTYSGTQATLYQTLLHEIGHALGFASDVKGAVSFYQGVSAANINQLISAIASLAPASAATVSTSTSTATTQILMTPH